MRSKNPGFSSRLSSAETPNILIHLRSKAILDLTFTTAGETDLSIIEDAVESFSIEMKNHNDLNHV